jgi:hypothetical protein
MSDPQPLHGRDVGLAWTNMAVICFDSERLRSSMRSRL